MVTDQQRAIAIACGGRLVVDAEFKLTLFCEHLHKQDDADRPSDRSTHVRAPKNNADHTKSHTIRSSRTVIIKLLIWAHADTAVFFCGLLASMHDNWRALHDIGVTVKHLHREVFGLEPLDFVS